MRNWGDGLYWFVRRSLRQSNLMLFQSFPLFHFENFAMPAEPVTSSERINLNRIDLNLLTVFSALLEERSVSRAAARLHVTQPAVSNALARLRDLVGDPLLIKTRKGMEPTERALELLDPVRNALAKIHLAVENARPFDPATSAAEVSIAVDEFVAHMFMPAVAHALVTEAPGLAVHVRRIGAAKDKMRTAASHHFVLTEPGPEYPDYHCIMLIQEGWKLVARHNHPQISGKLSVAQYAALPSVVPWYEGSGAVSWIDEALREHGLERRVATRIGTPSPVVTAGSDQVMVLPESMARSYALTHGLAVHDLPLDGPGFETALLWHKDYDAAPMHHWVRERMVKICRRIAGEQGDVLPLSRAA